MTKRVASERFQWGILASFGLIVPALILFMRLRFMCPTLELKGFDFLPLSGVVNGRDPNLFCRGMHDLTHPIFLLGYAVVLTYLAIRCIGKPLSEKSSQVLFCGLALFHLIWLVSYFITLFLPIGDMVEVISSP